MAKGTPLPLKGTPIPHEGSRKYVKGPGRKAIAYHDQCAHSLYLDIEFEHDWLCLDTDEARDLIAILLQFLADAEVS